MTVKALIVSGHLRGATAVSSACGLEKGNPVTWEIERVSQAIDALERRKKRLFEKEAAAPEMQKRMILVMLCSPDIESISFSPCNREKSQILYVQKGESLPELIEAPFLQRPETRYSRQGFLDAGSIEEGIENFANRKVRSAFKNILKCYLFDTALMEVAIAYREKGQLVGRRYKKVEGPTSRPLFNFIERKGERFRFEIQAITSDQVLRNNWRNKMLLEAGNCLSVDGLTIIPAESKTRDLVYVKRLKTPTDVEWDLYDYQQNNFTFKLPVENPQRVFHISENIGETLKEIEMEHRDQILLILECFYKDSRSRGIGLTLPSGTYVWLKDSE